MFKSMNASNVFTYCLVLMLSFPAQAFDEYQTKDKTLEPQGSLFGTKGETEPVTDFGKEITDIYEGEVQAAEDIASQPAEKRFGYKGAVYSRVRHENRPGRDPQTFLQARLQIDGYLNVTKDGCLQLKGRLTSGEKYSTNWSDTGVGDKDENYEFHMRYLFVNYECYLEKVAVQAGAMPVITTNYNGAKNTGWVDGGRITYRREESGTNISFTAGEVDELDTPSVFSRSMDGINYLQVFAEQNVTDNLTAYVDLTQLEENTYLAMTFDMIVSDYLKFLDNIVVEEAMVEGRHQAFLIEGVRKTENWTFTLGFSSREEFQGYRGADVLLPVEGFFGAGDNVYFVARRKISKRVSLYFKVRDGDAGLRAETGIKVGIGG